MCDQQCLRSACAYSQSDQSLCLSLEYKLLTEEHLEFLSLTGGCTGSSESTLVKMSHCWKSHAVAHIIIFACSKFDYYSFQIVNINDTDQTALVCTLVNAFSYNKRFSRVMVQLMCYHNL